jgi:hypothetical protein
MGRVFEGLDGDELAQLRREAAWQGIRASIRSLEAAWKLGDGRETARLAQRILELLPIAQPPATR